MSAPSIEAATALTKSGSSSSLASTSSHSGSTAPTTTATPTASLPTTPRKHSTASTSIAATSPKKVKLSLSATTSARNTPRKASLFRPSTSNLGDLDKQQQPPRQNVVVCVRMRPSAAGSDGQSAEPIWSFDQQQNQIVPTEHHPSLSKRTGSSSANAAIPPTASITDLGSSSDDHASSSSSSSATYNFQFDRLLVGNDSTDDMYHSQIAPVVKAAMDGYNGTVFAYGQTGSGKTHTMSGSESEPGVIPRAVEQVFKTIQQEPSREFLLRVSYLEIYNETLKDLLAPLAGGGGGATAVPEAMRPASPTKGGSTHSAGGSSNSSSLRIVEDRKSNRVVITGLREEIVTDPATVLDLIKRGQESRHVGATDWNERSSRSHCVFQVTIESRAKMAESSSAAAPADGRKAGGAEVRVSQLNLIDLAGSERAASQAERRKEGAFINKSLLTLGTVIAKLTEPSALTASSSDLHIPYRDSKLTRILQTSLSGNARIAVICTLSPDVRHAVETLSTLKFGKRCKMVVTSAKKGTSMDDKALLQKYRKELDALRAKLEAGATAAPTTLHHAVIAENDEAALASTRESRQKLDALNEEREKAQKEVEEMEKKRGDLRGQIDHLTRLILTSQSVAQEPNTPTNADGTPHKRNYGAMERRGPRLSDLHSFSGRDGSFISQSPSLDVFSSTSTSSATPAASSGKPFELETEIATLRKQLQAQLESRQALIAAHQAELLARDARERELDETIRINEEELDEAEVAFDRLKEEREEARRVALKEQEKARDHKRAWLEEQEANRLFKLVAKSRGVNAEEAWQQQVDALKAQLEERDRQVEKLEEERSASQRDAEQAKKALQEEIEAGSKKVKAARGDTGNDDDDPQSEFRDLVKGGDQAALLREKEETLAELERRLDQAAQDLERRKALLASQEQQQKTASRPLPVPQGSKQLDDLEASLTIAQAQNQDLSDQLSQLRSSLNAAATSTPQLESEIVELQLELEGSRAQVAQLQSQLDASTTRASRPLPVPTASAPRSTPSSPMKGCSVSRLSTASVKGLNRGGSVREYRRYQSDDVFAGNSSAPVGHRSSVLGYKAIFDGMESRATATSSSGGGGGTTHRAEREEIERLNAVIQSQRAIMSDLERSVASWKNRLKKQADLIEKLAAGGAPEEGKVGMANITPPMQDGELPSNVRVFDETQPMTMRAGGSPTKISRFDSPDSTSRHGHSNTLPRSSRETPYYGAHTYNRPPSTIGLGVGIQPSSSPTKPSSPFTPSLFSHPSPLPPPPSSPSNSSPRKRKPRITIENELIALRTTPRVEESRNRFMKDDVSEEGEGIGRKKGTSAAAFYI